MSESGWVLCVDDDERLLSGLELQLGFDYEVRTAESGQAGLEILKSTPGCAVIISDMRMPNMNGARFLAEARKVSPDSTRMLLTGFSEVEAAIDAINHGGIFRFLTKPIEAEALKAAVADAFRQYELVRSERVLLEQTVRGAAAALTEALEIASPIVFSRARRLESGARHLATELNIDRVWEVALGGLLLRLGWISLPQEVVEKRLSRAGRTPDPETTEMLRAADEVSVRLIGRIPRLEGVAKIVADVASPSGRHDGPTAIAAVADLDDRIGSGMKLSAAIEELSKTYSPPILDALARWPLLNEELAIKQVRIKELREGMVVEAHIYATNKQLLVRAGSELTDPLIQRLRNFYRSRGVVEPVTVSLPKKSRS
jgi:FixJ family two-component response regulator